MAARRGAIGFAAPTLVAGRTRELPPSSSCYRRSARTSERTLRIACCGAAISRASGRVDRQCRTRHHIVRHFAVMIRSPELFEMFRRDQLQAGRGNGRIAKNVEILGGNIARHAERVPSLAVRVTWADKLEVDDHGPTAIELRTQKRRCLIEARVVGRERKERPKNNFRFSFGSTRAITSSGRLTQRKLFFGRS